MKIQLLYHKFTFKELKISSTEGAYHRLFGKCAQYPKFHLWAKIFENIHITKSNIIYFLVNIWRHKKNLQDTLTLQKWWTGVIFGHLSWFSWTKTIIYFFFISKNKIICWRITLAATILTTNSHPSTKRKIHPMSYFQCK